MAEINIVDIDYTLWKKNIKVWIVDKRYPKNAILKISYLDAMLIKKGIYKSDKFKINYNGFIGFLDKDLYLKIQHKKTIDLDNIGLSFREFYMYDETNDISKTVDYFKSLNINNINLLTTKNVVNDIDVNIIKLDNFDNIDKLNKLLEFIIGYKVNLNSFVPISTEKYRITSYYDLDESMDSLIDAINDYLKTYLDNTVEWLKNKILLYLKENEIIFKYNKITTNKMNPFIKTKYKITAN